MVDELVTICRYLHCRISKGRSIREFVIAVLGVPTIISMLWFTAFGITGIEIGKQSKHIFSMPPETQLFGIFNECLWVQFYRLSLLS